jgi:hypothetical protein
MGLVQAATTVPKQKGAQLQDMKPPGGRTQDLRIEDGRYVLGDSPGLGIQVDEAAIAAIDAHAWLSGTELSAGPHVRPENAGRRLLPQPRDERRLTGVSASDLA